MIKVKNAEGISYDGPGHFGVYGIKKITGEQAKHFICNYSYFQPNGGCVMGAAPLERIYFMMSGTMRMPIAKLPAIPENPMPGSFIPHSSKPITIM